MTLEEMKQNMSATKYTDSPRVRTRKDVLGTYVLVLLHLDYLPLAIREYPSLRFNLQ